MQQLNWQKPRALYHFLKLVWKSFIQHKGLETAKSLTYTSLFAVVPLLTTLLSILSAFPSFQVFSAEIQDMVLDRLLPSTSSQLQEYFQSFLSQAKNLTWVGAVMLLVTSFLMLINIERNFNRIWGVRELRKGLSSFLLYWSVLSLGPLLLGMGFAISSYITSLQLFTTFTEVSEFVGVNSLALKLFPLITTTFGFTLLYVAVPNCGVRFVHGLIGGLVVALSFSLVKKGFTWFISVTSYELVYGTFAAIPILLFWLYIGWAVILLGANLVRTIPMFTMNENENGVHPLFVMLALLGKFGQKQQGGESLRVYEIMKEKWPFGQASMEHMLDLLVQKKVIMSINQSEYVLMRDLHNISLWKLFSELPWPLPGEEDTQQSLPSSLQPYLPNYADLQRRLGQHQQALQEDFQDNLGEFLLHRTS